MQKKCSAFAWGRVHFLHGRLCGAMYRGCEQNSVVGNFWR